MSAVLDALVAGDGGGGVESEPITVLHVDDDPDLLELAARFLERADGGLEVVSETSADAALERLAGDDRIDCIVSDYRMPGTDGIEFLEAVRERWQEVPFVLFTAEGSEAVAERAISAGVTDYFRKETGTEQYAVLANRIESVVNQYRTERDVEELVAAIESTREGVSLLDEAGRFKYVNRAYAELFGHEKSELVGEHWSVVYSDAEAEHVREEVLPNVPTDGTWSWRTTRERPDGSPVVIDHVLAYTCDGSIVCNVHDVTDPEPDDAFPTTALDALEDLLFVFGEDGVLEYWNERVPELTGVAARELASTTPAELVADDAADRMDRYVRETREVGESRIEAAVVTAEGNAVEHEFISKRVTGETGDVVVRVGLGRDISTRKEYERRIERQNDRLEQFAGVVSHDLRNPLFVAEEQFRIFRETGERDHYEKGQRALARIESLITDVLSLAQSGDPIHLEEYETTDLAAVADRAWSLIELDGTSLEITESMAIEADESRLRQLLENLLRNSIEHGGTDVSIRVGTLDDGSGFYVADDGPGIPAEEREAVFETGYSTKTDGTGFGLATVDLLVDAHGWTVDIAESDEWGARFEITGVETGPDA